MLNLFEWKLNETMLLFLFVKMDLIHHSLLKKFFISQTHLEKNTITIEIISPNFVHRL